MKYRLEYHPNRNFVAIHIDRRIVKHNSEICFDEYEIEERDELPQLLKDLFHVDGITSITLYRYVVCLGKALMFEWPQIIPTALDILKTHLDIDGVLEEGGKPFRFIIDKNGDKKYLPLKKKMEKKGKRK
jgi:hypothetical protein